MRNVRAVRIPIAALGAIAISLFRQTGRADMISITGNLTSDGSAVGSGDPVIVIGSGQLERLLRPRLSIRQRLSPRHHRLIGISSEVSKWSDTDRISSPIPISLMSNGPQAWTDSIHNLKE